MSFYPVYQSANGISPEVRGLARLMEGGCWILWCGDGGAWRNLTPPMEEWDDSHGIRGLRAGRTIQFSRVDRDVCWPTASLYGEGRPLTTEEKELLYGIYEHIYLAQEREHATRQAEADRREEAQSAEQWRTQLLEAAA